MIASTVLKVLIVVTSHSELGTTGRPTGYYLPEVTHPAHALELKGIEFDIASIKGGKAPMDERSRDLSDPINKKYLSRVDFLKKIEKTLKLADVNPSNYNAILFAGGHGTMWDFRNNLALSDLATKIYENGGVVAAVCHGPAALLDIKLSTGDYLLKDKKVAGFSNAEEEAAGLNMVMPFLLESELVERGGKYTKAALWEKHVVVDERLVTGQNPASANAVGEAIAKLLKEE